MVYQGFGGMAAGATSIVLDLATWLFGHSTAFIKSVYMERHDKL
jgi:hypothetical protein